MPDYAEQGVRCGDYDEVYRIRARLGLREQFAARRHPEASADHAADF